MHVSPGQTAPRRGERKRPWELSAVGSGVLTAQMSLGRNDSVTPPTKFLTPLMMCCGGILTTTRRVTSSFGPEVLIPSMGDRSGSEKRLLVWGYPQAFLHLPATSLSR